MQGLATPNETLSLSLFCSGDAGVWHPQRNPSAIPHHKKNSHAVRFAKGVGGSDGDGGEVGQGDETLASISRCSRSGEGEGFARVTRNWPDCGAVLKQKNISIKKLTNEGDGEDIEGDGLVALESFSNGLPYGN